MNLSALRTVPRRSWWTLAVAILLVCAFVIDRDLGVTMIVIALVCRFIASALMTSPTKPLAPSHENTARLRRGTRRDAGSSRTEPWSDDDHSLINDDDCALQDRSRGHRLNPATGLFMNDSSGLDSAGYFYGESSANRPSEKW
jgi:hypothetical protein